MVAQFWCSSFASVIGTSHQKKSSPCQDAGLCKLVQSKEGQEVLLAVISDGAGSAPKSDIGSKITVDFFMREFESAIEDASLINIDNEFVLQWLKRLRGIISEQAEIIDSSPKDFACTILGAIVGPNNAVFFQIGDGAIIVSEKESQEYSPIFWPQHGEFANQTNFITGECFAETLQYNYCSRVFDKIALFSDGIERLILDFSTKKVYPPALASIFDWLETKTPIHSDIYCPALVAFLGSEFINSRTDDDKTLVIARRIQSSHE